MHPELFTIPFLNKVVPSYGAAVLLAYLSATLWMTWRMRRVKCDPDAVLTIALISLIMGTVGGRTFYIIHYWREQFADNPWQILNLQAGGFEVYGGIICGFVFSLLYVLARRLPARVFADAAAPSMLLGMGIGRLGCYLFGCCWGGPCPADLPWAVRFPYGSPAFVHQWDDRLITVPAEFLLVDGKTGMATPIPTTILNTSVADLEGRLAKVEDQIAKAQGPGSERKLKQATRTRDLIKLGLEPLLAHYAKFETTPEQLRPAVAGLHTSPVHPSQLYGAIGPILLALVSSAWFYRRKHHGTVMPLTFMLYAVERFIEEAIRTDNPHDTFGLTISQGISVVVFLVCVAALLIILRLPPRAANVVPWRPPAKEQAGPEESAATPA